MSLSWIDMRTVLVGYAISNLVALVVMAVLWSNHHRRFAGLGCWLADFVLQLAALILIVLRGALPPLLSMTCSNAMVVGGTMLLFLGLQRFTGTRVRSGPNGVLLVTFVLAHGYFVLILPSLAMRNVLFSLALLAICAQCAWLLLRRVPRTLRPVTSPVGNVLLGLCAVSVVRVVVDTAVPLGDELFRVRGYDALLLITYQMLSILLVFSLVLMVNRQLLATLESDVAVRRRAEGIIKLRLALWEYSATHSTRELMQRALDELEPLTGSLIGFYHLVEEDGQTIELQAWSTRTRTEFCKAEAEGMRYPIDQAGVWVDCVRERRPVIHNDYAALPHRRGLPPGHAQVVRELVVPALRAGRVVSILGIGNKHTAYDDKDVELVAYIADLVWTIVAQKRSDERLLQLNTQLERQAMTDELTGLANRRSFFLRGNEEIGRARRYQTPLAVMMLDLDRFKDTNDTFGHEAGDLVLQCVAQALRVSVREVDLAARLGGEEFGVLLPSTSAADAAVLAERMRQAIAAGSRCREGQQAGVTASIGVAGFAEGMRNLDALLRAADAALYQAKAQGRDRVVVQA
jgi:diguanylate cyclase (GGDEF)-like protein